MRIFALVADAFGGSGGIAKFNRDLLTALCTAPGVERVVALPRLSSATPELLPDKLEFNTSGVGGRLRYVAAVLQAAIRNRQSAIVLCGHINLLPLAFLVRKFLRPLASGHPPSLLLVIHGIDAWRPTRSTLVNRFAGWTRSWP
jgi:phosphatidylinositol alpha-1,6-mannosyltransferase